MGERKSVQGRDDRVNHGELFRSEGAGGNGGSLAFTRMPRAEARGAMARDERAVARRAKSGGFGAVPLGFATDAPRGRAGSFT